MQSIAHPRRTAIPRKEGNLPSICSNTDGTKFETKAAGGELHFWRRNAVSTGEKNRRVLHCDTLCRKTFPGKDHWTADLSTTLLRSSGRDDKGEGGASIECGCRTEP